MARAMVLGAGYVGLATAIGLAVRGHQVEVIETRPDRLEPLIAGVLPLQEPGLAHAFAQASTRDRLSFANAPMSGRPEVVFICVGTAAGVGDSVDLAPLEGALLQCGPMNHAGIPLVVRSTVPPGLPQLIQRTGLSSATVFANPEFLRQGRAFEDFQNPDRVVVGAALARSSIALGLVVDLLTVPGVTLLVVSIEEAGLIKTASNAYLALRLAFANEVAMLCEQTGADVGQVLGGMKLDPRIGRQFLDPGYGFGGSCLPKDVSSLAVSGASLGIDMQLMTAITRANKLQTTWFARRIASELRPGCRRVALLGLAFKAGTDDVRGSPSLRLARLLLESGISVVGYDPVAGGHARQAFAGMEVVDSIEAAVAGADAAVIGTGWSVFSTMDWGPLVNIMRRPLIFDGRRVLDPSSMRALGFEYTAVGSASPRGCETGRSIPEERHEVQRLAEPSIP